MRRISTKRKKELYGISSLLLHLVVFIILLISLGTDNNQKANVQADKDNEKAPATSLDRFFASAHP